MTRAQPNVYIFDVDVWTIERGPCNQTFKWFATKPAWSKAKIGAARHRIGNSLHTDLAGDIRFSIRRELRVLTHRRERKQISRTKSIKRRFDRHVVFTSAWLNQ